ncbi:InlB B-repeat-containing protein [Adhaeribacter soli]|uniref:InlB B-repeat-containing protein n=1 Tax=Adhaeribacter soli TaxID=2607655 RepID=UPI001784B23F|nr:metallophosphoesterase [Adhaeribacter soli]
MNLINANTNLPIRGLVSGDVLNLATLPTRKLNIQAVTNPSLVGSVVFNLSGQQSKTRSDDSGPHYSLQGDSNGDYSSWTPAVGSYTLKAQSFSGSNGIGTAGTAILISFTVIDQIAPQQYSMSVSVNGSGTVSQSSNQTSYTRGATVTLTATPGPGSQFTGWSGDAAGNTNPLTVTMDSDKVITATFSGLPEQYNLNVTANGSGTVAKSPNQTTYSSGTSVTLTATPNSGYKFSGWSGDVTGTTNPVTITMSSDNNITATFTPSVTQYNLNITTKGSGTVTKSPDQASYAQGTAVLLTATPNAGAAFTGWSGDATGKTNPLTVTMNSNKNLAATFAQADPGVLLPFGSVWKYHDLGTNLGTTWSTPSFNDTNWKSGPAKLGYGISDAATVVSYGSSSSARYITTYFRKSITIADINQFGSYTGSVKRDDAVRIFINGTEVYRNNLPGGTVSYSTLASSSTDGITAHNFTINRSAFVTGTNVIAVEIHQVSQTSSDLAFDLKIVGEPLKLTRGPYLQMGNQSGVTLRWRTNVPSDSKIEVGTAPGTYTLSTTNPVITTEHEVRIDGLVPNTRYYYRFGSSRDVLQNGVDNYFKTAPPATSTDKVRVAVFGDCGLDKNGSQAATLNSYLKHTGSNPAELMLLLGDNAYNDGTDSEYQSKFFNPYGSSILKNHIILPTPGNHDYGNQASRTDPYYKIFSMPTAAECGGVASGTKAFYSYDWGNIHFISLDSYGTESPGSTRLYDTLGTQVQWLKKDLAATDKKWIVAFWHHPPYSMGGHNSDTEDQMVKIRQNFIRILERGGVDLVLCGHSHVYERSYLLNNHYGNEKSFSKAIHAKSTSSARYDGTTDSCPYVTVTGAKNHGTVYVVSGSAGAADGSIASAWPHNAMPYSFNRGGMLYLEVTNNRLDGKFLRQDGVVADQFTIMQNVNKTSTKTAAYNTAVKLTASWVGSYKWSTGETTKSITVTATKDTTYRVTDSNNCLTDVFDIRVTSSGKVAASSKGKVAGETKNRKRNNSDFLRIYPSKVQRGTNITVETNPAEEMAIRITDSNGTLIRAANFFGTTTIETSNLAAGVYFVQIYGKDKVKTQKVVVTN